MGIRNPHLDDAAFAEVWTERMTHGDADLGRPSEKHLQTCAECRARYASFAGWLETMRADALAEASEAFGGERLAAQQTQVMRRLETLEHPGRVIAFPFARPVSAQQNFGRRWVAVAAAAGLIVGLGLGQVLEYGSGPIRQPEAVSERVIARGNLNDPARMGVQPASQISDEAFFDDLDLVPSQVRVPESLQYLNAITPTSRDLNPR